MDTSKSMFNSYMKNHAFDATKENGDIVKVFFKEMSDTDNSDRKFMFADLGKLHQGELLEVEGIKWLVFQEAEPLSKQSYCKMVVLRIEHTINYGIDSILHSTHGRIELGNQGVSGSQYPYINGKMIITLARDEFTEKIKANDRLIKFNVAWVVEQTTTEYKGLVTLYLAKTSTIDGDDLVNEIPSGVKPFVPIISESRWDKTILKVIERYTGTASIYEYVDNVPTDTTFTYRVDGIPTTAYTITDAKPNSITIKCNKMYYMGKLVGINAKTLEEISIDLELKGMF
jgi:hypothetical protein